MSSSARRFSVQGTAGSTLDPDAASSSSLHVPSAGSANPHGFIDLHNHNLRLNYHYPPHQRVSTPAHASSHHSQSSRILDSRASRPLHCFSGNNDPWNRVQPVTTISCASNLNYTSTNAWQSLPYAAPASCMQRFDSVEPSGSLSFGLVPANGPEHRQHSRVAGEPWTGSPDISTMSQSNFASSVEHFTQQQTTGFRDRKGLRRTPSASTGASTHAASPFEPHLISTFPRIASAEFSPEAAALQAQYDAQFVQKSFVLDPSAMVTSNPSIYMTNPANPAHQAMRSFAIDNHNADDREPEFTHSSRHSISTPDNASPATPGAGDADVVETPPVNASSNETNTHSYRPPLPNLQLFRTESQAYQDELYNPSQETITSTPAKKTTSTYLSPHQAMISERLQAANDIRSQSPSSLMSRERSPFREGAQLTYGAEWRSPGGMGTAAGLRRYQKEQAEQAEYARTRGQTQPEQTKTISPKDAQLELNEVDQPSLFQDSIPTGYKQHNTGGDAWTNDLVDANDLSFGFQTPPVTTSFRQDMPTTSQAEAFNLVNMGQNTTLDASQLPNVNFRTSTYTTPSTRINAYLSPQDVAPTFPATLTSMDSSISDTGPPSSADDAAITNVQRPADTRANTGTYTCTYHGCTQRFDSHMNLQKHKREVHRAARQHLSIEPQSSPHASSTASSGGASPSDVSSRSTASPDPSGMGMTSAAIMARNSQAGPHKCTRINPSTGKPCNTIFSRPYDLTRHEDTIHNNRKQKVRCPLCREEKTFSRNDALTRHMRVVHPEVEAYGKRGRRDGI